MADAFRVAIIGCGARGAARTGAARAHAHWRAYAATGRCRLVALADIVPDNMTAFTEEYGDPAAPPAHFTDYREMLAQAHPDIVSICTWPALHAPMVVAAAQAGVRAIHCEKPMAPTWA
jgi:predicted dehydrogenase